MKKNTPIIDTIITSKIHVIREQKVMIDRDLAELYGVETKVLKQAVRRNIERFPKDFMFKLTKEELENWRSQIVTSNSEKMGLRHAPFAFTEQGVAMLSSVLRSKQAIQMNIEIIRVFTKLRRIILDTANMAVEIEKIKKKLGHQDKNIDMVIRFLDRLMPHKTTHDRKKIGYTK